MTKHTRTAHKISFESDAGEFDLMIDERGLSIRMFRVGSGYERPAEPLLSEHLPMHMAEEIRDFLTYALRSANSSNLKDVV